MWMWSQSIIQKDMKVEGGYLGRGRRSAGGARKQMGT
jgi:hypothetical protein